MTKPARSNASRRADSRSEPGQILVIVAASMLVIIGAVGLVIDGGYAWGRQRQAQNGVDSAAEAGAVVLAQRLASVARSDADVAAAVAAAAAANDLATPPAYYTDVYGNLLAPDGSVAGSTATAATVGAGLVPVGAQGVEVHGAAQVNTFLARAIGIEQLGISATATAVAGYLESVCPAASGCDVLPVTVPITVLGCDGQNDPQPIIPPTYWVPTGEPITVPLCKAGPGNVGWLDWTPTAGGVSELVQSILYPDNPEIRIPSWQYITATGNVNSAEVEDAINSIYSGKVVKIPQFDSTCDAAPTGPGVNDCPAGHVGGNGQQQWYHLPQFAAFQLCGPDIPECVAAGYTQGAYINGNFSAICDTGNGATSCLAGRFVYFIDKGTVGPGSGAATPTNVIGVQLIH